jgi:hypothetical protein
MNGLRKPGLGHGPVLTLASKQTPESQAAACLQPDSTDIPHLALGKSIRKMHIKHTILDGKRLKSPGFSIKPNGSVIGNALNPPFPIEKAAVEACMNFQQKMANFKALKQAPAGNFRYFSQSVRLRANQ